MAVKHPDDQQIQMYLDNTLPENKEEFDAHLYSCEDCRQKLAEYREVYQALEEDPYPLLSANFSKNVMDKLQIKQKFRLLSNEYLQSGLVIFTAIVVLMILMKPWDILRGIIQSIGNQAAIFLTSIPPLLGGKAHLVVGICLILLIIEIIDYKFLRPRFRHMN